MKSKKRLLLGVGSLGMVALTSVLGYRGVKYTKQSNEERLIQETAKVAQNYNDETYKEYIDYLTKRKLKFSTKELMYIADLKDYLSRLDNVDDEVLSELDVILQLNTVGDKKRLLESNEEE